MSAVDCSQYQASSNASGKSKQPSSSADTIDETTGFFSLPRELRDEIYDLLCLEDEQKPNGLNKTDEIIDGPKYGSAVYARTRVPQARLVS
jgi:hypothetical protein